MSQLTIQLSDKADALIAQLQKEIFSRRRKKVSAAGVVETLVESGAKSQSDKRFATSWTNLIADIEKAAKLAITHGAKPANLSDEEWALVLSHRSRGVQAPARRAAAQPAAKRKLKSAKPAASEEATPAAASPAKPRRKSSARSTPVKPAGRKAAAIKAAPTKAAATKAAATKAAPAKAAAVKTDAPRVRKARSTAVAKEASPSRSATPARSSAAGTTTRARSGRSSVASRMAKAAGRLASAAPHKTLPLQWKLHLLSPTPTAPEKPSTPA